jgi:hypothetical protein
MIESLWSSLKSGPELRPLSSARADECASPDVSDVQSLDRGIVCGSLSRSVNWSVQRANGDRFGLRRGCPSTRVTEELAQGTIRLIALDAACHERASRSAVSRMACLAEARGRIETAHLRQGYGGQSSPDIRAKVGGGAGIRTRVRKYILAGIYDAYPRLKSRSRREAAARTARSQPQRNLAATVQGNR